MKMLMACMFATLILVSGCTKKIPMAETVVIGVDDAGGKLLKGSTAKMYYKDHETGYAVVQDGLDFAPGMFNFYLEKENFPAFVVGQYKDENSGVWIIHEPETLPRRVHIESMGKVESPEKKRHTLGRGRTKGSFEVQSFVRDELDKRLVGKDVLTTSWHCYYYTLYNFMYAMEEYQRHTEIADEFLARGKEWGYALPDAWDIYEQSHIHDDQIKDWYKRRDDIESRENRELYDTEFSRDVQRRLDERMGFKRKVKK